ncbi:sensor histidine kinase [Clostridium thermarum]|uniref:sensor histidine kinase n=1 Tax=Clostridium thermarum TaxID=1716543 RepID=UPI00111F0E82|nr:ATP-binding protein [Clostridium thermarum]
MLLKICDLLNTFCQAFIFTWVTQNIVDKEKRISKKSFVTLIGLICAEVIAFTYSNFHSPFANFLMIVLVFLLVAVFFRKSIIEALIGVGISYFIIAMLAYFLVTFYQTVLIGLNLPIRVDVQMLLFIFVPAWIIYGVLYKVRRSIFGVAIFFRNLRHSLFFVLIIDISLVILDTFRIEWTIESMNIFFKFFIYLLAFISFVSVTVFFAKINSKSKEVEMLNKALNEKIVELKKLKHDYGSEISTLYGLYQLKRYDRMGEILKDIVDRYQMLSFAINVSHKINPIVFSVLHHAVCAGINVITIDEANYDNLAITHNELLKLLSNIVNNAVDVLKSSKNPTIRYKSYNSFNGVTIVISNNGPEIPAELKNKIFEPGFSTKSKEAGDRGYGLSIVKDIMNRCGGKIYLKSNSEYTQFKFEIPNTNL